MEMRELFDAFVEKQMEKIKAYEELYPKFLELAKKKRPNLDDCEFGVYDDECDGETLYLNHIDNDWWFSIPVRALKDGEYYCVRYYEQ